jgi:hypothetical protein
MIFRKLIFFFVFSFFILPVIAQGGISIKASIDKSRVLIGEPITLTIDAYFSPESNKNFIEIDSLKHFELLEKPELDTIDKNGGLEIRGVYKITSFDSGHWVIPSFSLSTEVKTDTIPVEVVFSDFNPNQDYHEIKDIIEVTPDKKEKWWWYVAGGILISFLLIFYLFRKKKMIPATIQAVVIHPYQEAMKSLREIEKGKIDAKQFHSILTEIFRLYIYRKKGILSLQKTTDDLVVQLNEMNMSKDQFTLLAQSLRLSDFVKFAKYIPLDEDDRFAFETIKKSIDEIEKLG